MKVKIKKLSNDAIIPKYATKGDAGMDLFSIEDYTLKPGERKIFSLGFTLEFSKKYYARIAPKSGLALKYGIDTMAGVVDSGYRDEYKVILINLGTEDFVVTKGMKIAQLIFEKIGRAKMIEMKKLSESDRKGGFGSTGI